MDVVQALIYAFEYDAQVIHNQLQDVSHAESLLQPIADSHSINWLLGHIVSARSLPLKHVGSEPVWSDEQRARYRDGSAPIGAEGPGVLPLATLLEAFDESHERLIRGLQAISSEVLTTPVEYRGRTVFNNLFYYHFHETYHIGQMTMIGEALGKKTAYLT